MFTWKGQTIGAFITFFTMPFSPVPALTTDLTVPGAIILDNVIPAE